MLMLIVRLFKYYLNFKFDLKQSKKMFAYITEGSFFCIFMKILGVAQVSGHCTHLGFVGVIFL